jgi:hypothetical protein
MSDLVLKVQVCAAQHGLSTTNDGALRVPHSFFPTGPVILFFGHPEDNWCVTTSVTHRMRGSEDSDPVGWKKQLFEDTRWFAETWSEEGEPSPEIGELITVSYRRANPKVIAEIETMWDEGIVPVIAVVRGDDGLAVNFHCRGSRFEVGPPPAEIPPWLQGLDIPTRLRALS